jgi:hypothetical protein
LFSEVYPLGVYLGVKVLGIKRVISDMCTEDIATSNLKFLNP